MDVTPIETEYKGYRFRSRLEARWAVFFDELGIKYEYEPEGYDLGEHGWYLPDFWLPTFDGGMFCEVKPEGADFSKAEIFGRVVGVKMWFCEGAPASAIYKIYTPADSWGPEIITCGIPNWDEAGGEDRMFGAPCGVARECGKLCYSKLQQRPHRKIDVGIRELEAYSRPPCLDVYDAAIAARQARFEFGQVGAPKNWRE